MEYIPDLLGFFSTLEQYFEHFITANGEWAYLILFMLFFTETGFVFLSFLPGDSLLIAVGMLCSTGSLRATIVIPLILCAVVVGNVVNYYTGMIIGEKLFEARSGRLFNRANVMKANLFYNKYGGITIVVARFFPVLRAFAPLVAGIGKMDKVLFMLFSTAGGVAWVAGLVFAGMAFGSMPFMNENSMFSIIVMMLVTVVLFPALVFCINMIKKKYSDKVKGC